MIRISRGDVTFECDTESDVAVAMDYLEVALEDSQKLEQTLAVNAPQWRVGGPVKPHIHKVEDSAPPVSIAPQMIPVRRKLLDVLEVIFEFPDGIEISGVSTLIGVSASALGNRVTRLKEQGLIEKVPHHNQWRATPLARRAKLVVT